jgi:hypothetical protein
MRKKFVSLCVCVKSVTVVPFPSIHFLTSTSSFFDSPSNFTHKNMKKDLGHFEEDEKRHTQSFGEQSAPTSFNRLL